MKKSIIISIFAVFMAGAAWGQKLKVDSETLQSGVIKLANNSDNVIISWPVKNDTVVIVGNADINFGKIEHKSGKPINNFVVIENGKITVIDESSTNYTNNSLTIKRNCKYDFFKENTLFLTIVLKDNAGKLTGSTTGVGENKEREAEVGHDNEMYIADNCLLLRGDTLSICHNGLFSYKMSPNSLFYSNWPSGYHITLKGKELNPTDDNRLCCGDTVNIKYGKEDFSLVILSDEEMRNGIPSWVLVVLSSFILLLFIGYVVMMRKKKVLQSNVQAMNEDLLKAEELFNQVNEALLQPTLNLEENGNHDESGQQTLNNTNDDQKKGDGQASPNSEEMHTPSSGKKMSGKIEQYKHKDFSVHKEIVNGIGTLQKEKSTIIDQFENVKRQLENIKALVDSKGEKELEHLKDEIIKAEASIYAVYNFEDIVKGICALHKEKADIAKQFNDVKKKLENVNKLINSTDKDEIEQIKKQLNEVGTEICSLKTKAGHFEEILMMMGVNDYESAENKVRELLDLNNNPNNTNDTQDISIDNTDAERWKKVENFLRGKGKFAEDNPEEALIKLLEKYLDVNYFRNTLRSTKNESNQNTLNCYILETLGKQEKEMFSDAKEAKQDWITYLQEKFATPKEPTEEQKNSIVNGAVSDALEKDVSQSKVLKKVIQKLVDLLNNETDKNRLSGDGAKLQTIADILNDIPRSDEAMKQKGASEELKKLQKVLGAEKPFDSDGIKEVVQQYFEKRVGKEVDSILQRPEYRKKLEKEKNTAKGDGEKETLQALQKTLLSITKEAKADEKFVQEIDKCEKMEKVVKDVFDSCHKSKDIEFLNKEKVHLCNNPALKEISTDIEKYTSISPLISKLVDMIKTGKKEIQQKVIENTNLNNKLSEQAIKLENAARDKKEALILRKDAHKYIIKKLKEDRQRENLTWQRTNKANIEKIKEYHLKELTRIREAFNTIDEQLKVAYTNYDRNTPLGRLIDSSIKRNTFYSFDKFLEKVEGIGGNPTETASQLGDSMRMIYKECLGLTPPTWIDVLTRLYCYTGVPFIAEALDKANLDCQAIRQAFFRMENLLHDTGITIIYPKLFKEKLSDGKYEVKPERNIDNYVMGLAEHKPDSQTIIDLYTVGFQIPGEDPRNPVVSTY